MSGKYSEWNSALIKQVLKAKLKITEYTSTDVKVIHFKDKTYERKLTEIRNAVNENLKEIDQLLDNLDDVDKENHLSEMIEKLIHELKSNEAEVKQAMTRLILENPQDAADLSPQLDPVLHQAGAVEWERGEEREAKDHDHDVINLLEIEQHKETNHEETGKSPDTVKLDENPDKKDKMRSFSTLKIKVKMMRFLPLTVCF